MAVSPTHLAKSATIIGSGMPIGLLLALTYPSGETLEHVSKTSAVSASHMSKSSVVSITHLSKS